MKSTAWALWHDDPLHSSLQAVKPEGGAGEVIIRTAFSLVSQGTERLVACGEVPDAMHRQMAVPYQEGTLALPVKYGYSLSGIVTEGPSGLLGRRVHLMHPHQDRCRVRAMDCTVLPDGVPSDRACLASNLETALTAVWDSGVSVGDRALVVGFGLIGALTARLLKDIPAAEVYVQEPDPYRMGLARSLGFLPWNPPDMDGAADVSFHASATGSGFQSAIDAVGMEGCVVEMSWYGDRPVEVSLGRDFHCRRKKIISSQVSNIPGIRHHRWDRRRRKDAVLRLLQNPSWDDFLDRRIPFRDSPALFDQIRNRSFTGLTCLMEYVPVESPVVASPRADWSSPGTDKH